MEDVHSHLFELHDTCVRLCGELQQCLVEERACLVEFRVADLPQISLRKESLISAISRKRQEMREFARLRFGVATADEFAARLEPARRREWDEKCAEWRECWAKAQEACRRNQSFLEHSVKNLGLLVDNLKRVFGVEGTYSRKGQKVDSSQQGSVLRQSY